MFSHHFLTNIFVPRWPATFENSCYYRVRSDNSQCVKNTGSPFTIDECWTSLAFCYLWDEQNSVKIWSFSCKNINAQDIDLVVLHHKQRNLDLTVCQHENYSLWKGLYVLNILRPCVAIIPVFRVCLFCS